MSRPSPRPAGTDAPVDVDGPAGERVPAGTEAPAAVDPGAREGVGPGAGAVTRALVLAAGEGSRLDGDTPKPAFRLLGLPLLGRVLFTLQEVGVTDAHVVVGHRAGEVRRVVESLDRLELALHWIHNDRWRGRNGLSVLAAEPALGGDGAPFLLTMADHVVEPGLVADLLRPPAGWARETGRRPPGEGSGGRRPALALAVDPRPERVEGLDDATRVRRDGDRIRDIGKSLERYDAVDTGVFLATPALFEALRAVDRGEEGPALSDGVRRLADQGRARAVEVGGRLWQDVDDRRDARVAERKLLEAVRSGEDGPVARHLNRPLSTAVSRWLVRTPVTANQVSVATLGVGLLSAGFAAAGGYAAHLASGLLFQAASVLDGTDGEVAKLTFRSSRRGEWVDTICDNLAYLAFLVGLTVGVRRMGLPDLYFWSGLLAVGAATISMASINLHLLARDASGSARAVEYGYQEGEDAKSRVMQWLHYLGKRDMLALVVLALAVVGHLPLGLPVFGVAATVLMVPATGKALLSALRD